jgi:hypothetical protein
MWHDLPQASARPEPKESIMRGTTAFFAMAGLALPIASQAQVDWGPIIQAEAMGSAVAEAGREGAPRGTSRPATSFMGDLARSFSVQTAPRAAAPKAAAASAAYKPSVQVRQKLAGIMGDAAAEQSPSRGEEMRKLVLSGKALAEYERIAPTLGLKANDAIDAFTFYMLAQWGVANDYRADVTRAQVAGVRRQAANAYATVSDKVSTDALRQEFGEMLAIQGAILAGVHEAAVQSGDDAAAAKYAGLARQGGRTIFTMDPTRMILTNNGFRQKS